MAYDDVIKFSIRQKSPCWNFERGFSNMTIILRISSEIYFSILCNLMKKDACTDC